MVPRANGPPGFESVRLGLAPASTPSRRPEVPVPVPIIHAYAVCPRCGRKHGRAPTEVAFWMVKLATLSIIDGGPLLEVPLQCEPCKRRTFSR